MKHSTEIHETLAYQLGWLEGHVKAFLKGYGSREDLERAYSDVLEWEKSAEARRAVATAEWGAKLAGKIDSSITSPVMEGPQWRSQRPK
jgi:hypothetical protein